MVLAPLWACLFFNRLELTADPDTEGTMAIQSVSSTDLNAEKPFGKCLIPSTREFADNPSPNIKVGKR